jgi:hypothetical protein
LPVLSVLLLETTPHNLDDYDRLQTPEESDDDDDDHHHH